MVKIEKHNDLMFYLFCVLFTLLVFTPGQLGKGLLHVFASTIGFAFVLLFFPVKIGLWIRSFIKRRLKKVV